MVAIVSTEHSYWLALAFVAWKFHATNAWAWALTGGLTGFRCLNMVRLGYLYVYLRWRRQVYNSPAGHWTLVHTAPSYVRTLSTWRPVTTSSTRRHLRSAAHVDLVELRCRTTRYGKRSFPASGPLIWNSHYRRPFATFLFQWKISVHVWKLNCSVIFVLIYFFSFSFWDLLVLVSF